MRVSRLLASYRRYEGNAHRENGLMLARLSTLLSSQSFLTIAYTTTMASANGRWAEPFAILLPPFLALLGFVLALAGRSDIEAANREAGRWRAKAAALLSQHPDLRTHLDEGRDAETFVSARRSGELFATRAPLIFMLAWVWFFLAPLHLRFGQGHAP